MEALGYCLWLAGMGALFVGGLWILIEAFKTSILWGLGSLFIPFVSLIWLVLHWDRGGKPFFIQLGGVAVMFVGLAVGG